MTRLRTFPFLCWNLIVLPGLLTGYAQSNLRLNIARTNENNAAVTWIARSVVPTPGTKIVPDYRAEVSSNFTAWNAYGPLKRGSSAAQGKLGVVLTNFFDGGGQFVRIASIIDLQGADLINQQLNKGDFTGALMVGADLFGSSLQNAILDRANLEATDLRFCDLTKASLVGANLLGSRLVDAQLHSAILTKAIISYCDLTGADLFGANFSHSDARFSNFSEAHLEFVDMRHMRIDTNTILPAKWDLVWHIQNEDPHLLNLGSADFSFAFLESADLGGTLCTNADFSAADLQNANLVGTDFTGSNLRFIDLRGSLLDASTKITPKSRLIWKILNQPTTDRQLIAADLGSASLVKAQLIGADLSRADLSQSTFFFAHFDGAILANANLSGTDLSSTSFKKADLSGANLANAILEDATFLEANLTNAILNGASFRNTTMPDGTIRNF